jgi:VWFA-related protein
VAAVVVAGVAGSARAGAREPREYIKVVDRPYQRVGLTVTVIDSLGRPVRGMTREEFQVSEDGRMVELLDFDPEGARRDRPLSVAVLLDMSQSMRSQIKKVREAAQALLGGMRQGDEIMVAKFNDELMVLQPFTGDALRAEKTLKDAGRAWGGTALFRSIEHTLKDLRERPGRKVILVVSDGLDNDVARDQHVLQSLYLQDLLRLCFRTQTTVYGIRPGMSASSWLPFEGFVTETGGRLLYTGGDLERLFARLGEEFLSQYYLAYDIDPKIKEGKRRRIRVEVAREGVVVKTMGGYFTPHSHLKTLLADLRDDDVAMRADAAYELGFVGDPQATNALLQATDDKEERVRRLAAAALGRLGEEVALPRLIERLADPSSSVREAAASSLRSFGPRAIPALLLEIERGAAKKKAAPRVLGAADILGKVGDDRALEPLGTLLRDGPPAARLAAARALGDLGLSQGIPALRNALVDPSPEVRMASVKSIVVIAGAAARPVVEDYIKRETDPGLKEAARAVLGRP